jgi:putative colanic acid biosynthesis glycosyltransferase
LVGLSDRQINELPENIIGITRTENVQELGTLYIIWQMYLLIQPGLIIFQLQIIESLACGTPVITYDTGGSPEAIDQNSGYVIKKGDIEGLLFAIESMMHKDSTILTNSCRKRAVELYNKTDRYSDYISLYNEVIEKI